MVKYYKVIMDDRFFIQEIQEITDAAILEKERKKVDELINDNKMLEAHIEEDNLIVYQYVENGTPITVQLVRQEVNDV